jgi:hypothetical protein
VWLTACICVHNAKIVWLVPEVNSEPASAK